PLTLVLARRPGARIADQVSAGLDSVALRVPAHPVAQALLAGFGRGVAAPSANRSGHVSPTIAAHVAADLCDKVACVLDAGPTGIGVESTIIGLTGEVPVLLRLGGLPRAEIEAVLGVKLAALAAVTEVSAPGML